MNTQTKTVDFYFDFGSPAAYLAYTQLPKLRADTGATVVMKPVLLGGVFQSTGNRAPISVPLKGSYLFVDLARYAKRYGVPLVMNPFFPINTITLMRADIGLGLRSDSRLEVYREAMFRAIWIDRQNLNDPATVAALLTANGFDAAEIMAMVADASVKDALKVATQAAVDRLDFVREALA
jgi:2-hydroxychromene-2-carboxylate isomerase